MLTLQTRTLTEYRLILIIIVFLISGSAFLFWQNSRELNPDTGKNWWIVAFVTPNDDTDISFYIENHSPQKEFNYTILAHKKIVTQENISITPGATVIIHPASSIPQNADITIRVQSDQRTEEIYR
ncbi:MAG: hypothetical protein ACSLEX_02160 [Minisyncoccota bacterium]